MYSSIKVSTTCTLTQLDVAAFCFLHNFLEYVSTNTSMSLNKAVIHEQYITDVY